MKALVCGSMAFDTIMVFPDKFGNHILPDKVHMLNVSFLVPELRREFGGCAGNIAYNMALLGAPGAPMATVGQDFGAYADWMDKTNVSREYLTTISDAYTGQAYINTDMDDNQITAFHPGAMGESHQNKVPTDAGITLGIVSPDGRDGMIQHAEQFAGAGIPFIFDPGQGLPMFDGTDLRKFIDEASWVTVNDYECELLKERTGWSEAEIAEQVRALVVTRGGEGSTIYQDGQEPLVIPNATPAQLADPTGCGDAYRAGLIYGLMHDLDWATTGRIASLMGCIKIEQAGTQNHSFTLAEFAARYEAEFGDAFPNVTAAA